MVAIRLARRTDRVILVGMSLLAKRYTMPNISFKGDGFAAA